MMPLVGEAEAGNAPKESSSEWRNAHGTLFPETSDLATQASALKAISHYRERSDEGPLGGRVSFGCFSLRGLGVARGAGRL
jgi:hypothetical protein